MNEHSITHEGVVSHVEGSRVTVQFVQLSACAGCHAKMLCSGDSKRRSVVIEDADSRCQVGEEVVLEVTHRLARTAMLLAFGLPFVLAMLVLFPAISWCGELWACVLTLATIVLYYAILYLFRARLDRKVVFILHRKTPA